MYYYYSTMVVQIITILFHSCGLYLLRCVRHNGSDDVQLYLVMNLSACEVLLNLTYISLFSIDLAHGDQKQGYIKTIHAIIAVTSGSCFNFVYYFTMIYIAINKMLEVYLNLKYQLACNIKNVKYLLLGTWLFGGILGSCMLFAEQFYAFDVTNANNYFYTILDIMYIFIAIATHGYIFHKYRMSRMVPPHHLKHIAKKSQLALPHCKKLINPKKKRKQSLWKTFQGSRFYISCILIVTFLFLQVVPKLIVFFLYPNLPENSSSKAIIGCLFGVLYYVSFLADVFIYVFVHRHVKQMLWKKMSTVRFLKHFVPKKTCVLRTALQAQMTVASPMITSSKL